MTSTIRDDFAAFIITFNRPAILFETIEALRRQSVAPKKILIVNNGDILNNLQLIQRDKIEIQEYVVGANTGPSGGAYWGLRILSEQGYKWIQWIDDDDPPQINNLNERLFNSLISTQSSRNIGIIAKVGSKFNYALGKLNRISNEVIMRNEFLELDVIGGNQCMIINSDVVRLGCLPEPKLFFGFEDLNFCLKVRQKGFHIIVPCDLFIESRKLANRLTIDKSQLTNVNQPPWRQYYSVRSMVYMFVYDFRRPITVSAVVIGSFLSSLINWRRRGLRQGYVVFTYTIRAIVDGLFGRLGLRVLPERKY